MAARVSDGFVSGGGDRILKLWNYDEGNCFKLGLGLSGGITAANARAMAESGADCLSSGALTHSAPAIDISLEFR